MDDDENPIIGMMNELARFCAIAAVIAALIMLIAFVGPDAAEIMRSAN